LASYSGFEHRGFRIVAIFDSDPDKTGAQIGALTVQPTAAIPGVLQQYGCQIGVIAVPGVAAQGVANQLIASGVRSILCYAPITLTVPPGIRVDYIDPVISFQHMTFYLEKQCIE
jgi:redox-sensing transcriptional repressor